MGPQPPHTNTHPPPIMPAIMERAANLLPRYVCNGYYDNCYNSAWNSWALGRTPPGHAPAQYNSAAPYYANYQPQYNNSNNPPPPPSYGQSQSYYGQNADYYGRQNDVEL